MSDEELRERFDALGPPLAELPGERTYISRCATWEGFVERGPEVARHLRVPAPIQEDEDRKREIASGLYDLLMEAFPED
ncbi:MAG: hypothetical protein ACLFSI_08945 [Halorhodospira sp.]